jgi:hypothetical protein
MKFETAGALPTISEESTEEYNSNESNSKPEDDVNM